MTDIQQYIDLFEQHRDLICAHSCDVMNAVRDAACDHLRAQGLPTRHTEAYRYTDMRAMFAPDYGVNLRQVPYRVNEAELYSCDVPGLDAQRVYCINDMLWHPKAAPTSPKADVEVHSLRQLAADDPNLLRRYYSSIAPTDSDPITALNTMLAQDGIIIHIPRHCHAQKPVQLINLLHTGREMMLNRRLIIVAEAGSSASVLLCHHSAEERPMLTTEVVEVFVEDDAQLCLYDIEETHQHNRRVSNKYVRQHRGSRFALHTITLHNGTTRHNVEVSLKGEGSECTLNGCAIADKQQHVDNHTLISHHAARCQSRELYKYVLDEQSTGAFAGRIYVEEGAQATDAQMTNQNLLTNREARMWTQPVLEIYADDVKCAHGSTVGQLNDAALFYMQQRGIPLREARLLLEQAFVNEVIDTIPVTALRDRLRFLAEKRFRGELSKCDGCRLCK